MIAKNDWSIILRDVNQFEGIRHVINAKSVKIKFNRHQDTFFKQANIDWYEFCFAYFAPHKLLQLAGKRVNEAALLYGNKSRKCYKVKARTSWPAGGRVTKGYYRN
ncbi:hypothetical protein J6590_038278 [Homalodisca vitripennis]|nr:hypothetical protein J6590_038278 [Homalodisca vitripennis]